MYCRPYSTSFMATNVVERLRAPLASFEAMASFEIWPPNCCGCLGPERMLRSPLKYALMESARRGVDVSEAAG